MPDSVRGHNANVAQPNAHPRSAAQHYSPRPLTDGERWTADALVELRRGHYRPAAWLTFVRRSLERSSAPRRARPHLARQARGWGFAGALAWLAVCRASRPASTIKLRPA